MIQSTTAQAEISRDHPDRGIAEALAELETLARDTEEWAIEETDTDKGLHRALLSIVYRIRHATKGIS